MPHHMPLIATIVSGLVLALVFGAQAQIGIATLTGAVPAYKLGWKLGSGIVFDPALSVASTVVLLRALQDRWPIETEQGRIAAGWLFVAIPNAFEAGQVVLRARQIGAAPPIVARGHHEEEIEHLNKQGATMAIVGEHELARGMLARTVGAAPGAPPPDALPA